MDVLARLATEPPDLSDLPGELQELVRDCLQRVPRMRPSSSAMLAQLGPFAEARAGAEHSYLPGAAMALIGEYQRNPLLANGQTDPHGLPAQRDADHSQDATSASYTELPASYKPRSKRKPGHARQARASGSAGWWQRVRGHLAWVGWASVGAALVVGGVILGASLSSNGSPTVPPLPPAPPTVCKASVPAGPSLCMVGVSQGTTSTAFVIQGSGFAPGAPVTFLLNEASPPQDGGQTVISQTSPYRLRASTDGTFRVAFSKLYPGSLPLGQVTVKASPAAGGPVSTYFMVIPPVAPGGGPPPSS